MSILVRNPFTLDAQKHSLSSGLACKDESKTVQADAEAADINNIVKKFGVTGMLPYGDLQPVYDDFTDFPVDYHSAMNYIRDADQAFLEFPAEIREKFDNDPGQFLNRLADPFQREFFRDLGFIPPLEESPALGAGSESPTQQPQGVSTPPEGGGTVST